MGNLWLSPSARGLLSIKAACLGYNTSSTHTSNMLASTSKLCRSESMQSCYRSMFPLSAHDAKNLHVPDRPRQPPHAARFARCGAERRQQPAANLRARTTDKRCWLCRLWSASSASWHQQALEWLYEISASAMKLQPLRTDGKGPGSEMK